MGTEVMQTFQAGFDPASRGSLFSCSRSDIPCHHFCLRHSKPLDWEAEEWFMTDEIAEDEEEDEKEEDAGRQSLEDEEADLAQGGLLDQLLDEAYAQYYEEPDEWEELAHWYTSRMTSEEPSDAEHQSGQSAHSSGTVSSGAAQPDFHPAWRVEAEGTPGRFASLPEYSSQGRAATGVNARSSPAPSTSHRQHQPPIGTPPGRFAAPPASSHGGGGQRRSSEPNPAGDRQQPTSCPGPKQRTWAELADEQEREEEMELSSAAHRRRSGAWSETALAREFELYESFNDLFFPDPETGRL